MATRTRAADDSTRNEREPVRQWTPANHMETPKDGVFEYRWVAELVNGSETPTNVHRKMREGYQRVMIDDLPEDFLLYNADTGDGYTRYGGLILMRLPLELYAQRNAYFRTRSTERLEAANELQGVAGRDAVKEDRGTRSLTGADAGRALQRMNDS